MLLLQASIGSLNDIVDVGRDAGRKPGKPIPAGSATWRAAAGLVVAGLIGGLALSAPSGPATLAVACAGVACGYAYDLRLSRGPWSWLPLALALPLPPIHAFVGATGEFPTTLPALLPIGVLAGAGLALANGLADLERDVSAGSRSAAVRLGLARAWLLHAACLAAAMAVAIALVPSDAGSLARAGIGGGVVMITAGMVISRGGGAALRERAWEIEAIGVVALGIAWLAAVAAAG